jgi:hypothetical protein
MEGRMSNGKKIPAVPANEVIFLNEAMVNEEFRLALESKDKTRIGSQLDRLNISFDSDAEKQLAIDTIVGIDWSQLHRLEDEIGRGGLDPRMG